MRLAWPGKKDGSESIGWRKLLNSSWIWLSLLAILAAAILRMGFDLSGGWQAAYQAAFLDEHLHASSAADYSTDAFFGFIPAVRPGVLNDLAGVLLPGLGGPEVAAPVVPSPTPTPSPTPYRLVQPVFTGTPTPTLHPSEPTASPLPGQPSPTVKPTSTGAPAPSSTPTSTHQPGQSPTPRTPTPTRTSPPQDTPTPTRTSGPGITRTQTQGPSDTPVPPPPTTAAPPTVTHTSPPLPDTDTPVPPPPSATPFATRDPTRAVTPTAVYTPGGTAAPVPPAAGRSGPGGPLRWRLAGRFPLDGVAGHAAEPAGNVMAMAGRATRSP